MAEREWKPGDVAMVEDERGVQRLAVCGALNPRLMHRWHYDEQGIGRILHPRPLVVIDPEDREQVERLTSLYYHDDLDQPASFVRSNQMQAALREFANPTPPRPEEPTGLGAVVEDAEGQQWVRIGRKTGNSWYRPHGTYAVYAEIPAVRILSEGVTP